MTTSTEGGRGISFITSSIPSSPPAAAGGGATGGGPPREGRRVETSISSLRLASSAAWRADFIARFAKPATLRVQEGMTSSSRWELRAQREQSERRSLRKLASSRREERAPSPGTVWSIFIAPFCPGTNPSIESLSASIQYKAVFVILSSTPTLVPVSFSSATPYSLICTPPSSARALRNMLRLALSPPSSLSPQNCCDTPSRSSPPLRRFETKQGRGTGQASLLRGKVCRASLPSKCSMTSVVFPFRTDVLYIATRVSSLSPFSTTRFATVALLMAARAKRAAVSSSMPRKSVPHLRPVRTFASSPFLASTATPTLIPSPSDRGRDPVHAGQSELLPPISPRTARWSAVGHLQSHRLKVPTSRLACRSILGRSSSGSSAPLP
eukprot:Hpha_TRINITY_DN20000_c0_g1::TRINITY_DN20000_c0_g1_i1::g.147870::m.147870